MEGGGIPPNGLAIGVRRASCSLAPPPALPHLLTAPLFYECPACPSRSERIEPSSSCLSRPPAADRELVGPRQIDDRARRRPWRRPRGRSWLLRRSQASIGPSVPLAAIAGRSRSTAHCLCSGCRAPAPLLPSAPSGRPRGPPRGRSSILAAAHPRGADRKQTCGRWSVSTGVASPVIGSPFPGPRINRRLMQRCVDHRPALDPVARVEVVVSHRVRNVVGGVPSGNRGLRCARILVVA